MSVVLPRCVVQSRVLLVSEAKHRWFLMFVYVMRTSSRGRHAIHRNEELLDQGLCLLGVSEELRNVLQGRDVLVKGLAGVLVDLPGLLVVKLHFPIEILRRVNDTGRQ